MYYKVKLDQNNVYGNALVEYDENGKLAAFAKTWINLQAANGNNKIVVLELED